MNIANTIDCYGCGVCAVVCPKGIIHMEHNKDGFLAPILADMSSCNDCGLCVSVCSFRAPQLSQPAAPVVNSYAGWSTDDKVRSSCTSGGVGYELAKYLVEDGFSFCGVKYDTVYNRACHYIASSVSDLEASKGSKYIQSDTVEAFRSIRLDRKYFVTGTPCQIDSFRRYIRKFKKEDNFVLMDFFCHGVPSKKMWDRYLRAVKHKIGVVDDVKWRDKSGGWQNSYSMSIDGHKGYEKKVFHSSLRDRDAFYRLFLTDSCLGKACYSSCKYKFDKSSADIRIGDFWGPSYANDRDGVNAVVAFTERGDEILRNLDCVLIDTPLETVAEAQMKTNAKIKVNYHIVRFLLKIPFVPVSIMAFVVGVYNRVSRI